MKYVEGYVNEINEEWLETTGSINGENESRKIIVLEKTMTIEDKMGNTSVLKLSNENIEKGTYGYFFVDEDNKISSFYNDEAEMIERMLIEKHNEEQSLSPDMFEVIFLFSILMFVSGSITALLYNSVDAILGVNVSSFYFAIIPIMFSYFVVKKRLKAYKKYVDKKVNKKYKLINDFRKSISVNNIKTNNVKQVEYSI